MSNSSTKYESEQVLETKVTIHVAQKSEQPQLYLK